jgi:glycosyltransferase involved in cell wall biosynthesis
MKILAYVHGYPPNLNGGAEMMLHQMLLDLKRRGHEVLVITQNSGLKHYEGVRLYDVSRLKYKYLASWCDVIFTHLTLTKDAMDLGKKYNKKVVHLLHNDFEMEAFDVVNSARKDPDSAALVVANSNWVSKTIKKDLPTIVVNPPTKLATYEVKTTKEFVTLINLHYEKGGELFWKLAEAMPDVQFLGVKGGWGDQILKKDFPNVTILENTTDIQSIYAKTKILLVPSLYESWGRVAIEAACSGIPVIASPMPGPKESLGTSGIFIDAQDVTEWCKQIKSLENKEVYSKYSKATRQRAEKLDKKFDSQMNVLEKRLLKIVSEPVSYPIG